MSERDPNDSTRGWLRFKVFNQPPLPIAAVAGDAVHNFRSSLDYIVEELVKRNGRTPTTQHQFPICVTPDGFNQVKPEARPRHPLMHLRTLSNRDKHHMLAISALNAEFVWSLVGQNGRVFRSDKTTEPVHDGGILAVLPTEFVIEGQKVQLQSQLSAIIKYNSSRNSPQ